MSVVDRRLHGLDLARYLALAGMVLVNFRLAMAVPAEGEGWLAGFFHLLEGKASATFVTLAGLGLVLATLWLSPLILLTVLLYAWFRRWGLVILTVLLSIGVIGTIGMCEWAERGLQRNAIVAFGGT